MDGENQRARGPISRFFLFLWRIVQYAFDRLIDAAILNTRIVIRESDLFLGTTLALLGLFGFNAGKFCDGNTADYLSCTRPSAYYYFDAFDIALIVIGAIFILLWFMKRGNRA